MLPVQEDVNSLPACKYMVTLVKYLLVDGTTLAERLSGHVLSLKFPIHGLQHWQVHSPRPFNRTYIATHRPASLASSIFSLPLWTCCHTMSRRSRVSQAMGADVDLSYAAIPKHKSSSQLSLRNPSKADATQVKADRSRQVAEEVPLPTPSSCQSFIAPLVRPSFLPTHTPTHQPPLPT